MSNINKNLAYIFMIVLYSVLGFLIPRYDIVLVLGAVILLASLVLMVAFPELATWAVFFVIYANLSVIAMRLHGVPQVVAASVPLLFGFPLAHHLIIRRERLILDHIFLLMLVFLVVLLASSLFAKDMKIAAQWIITFLLEGLALYLPIINVIRDFATLRRVIWVLMLTCSLLGALSLYQEATQSYDNRFGGLAQRKTELSEEAPLTRTRSFGEYETGEDVKKTDHVGGAERAAGPLEAPNRYAQILLVILPFALFSFWGERSRWRRIGAAAAAIFILCGILLSYSRGACVTLILLLLILTCLRYIRPYQILLSVSVLILIVAVAAPRYLIRIDTMRGVAGLVSDEAEARPDGSTRGRVTEMLAALKAFLDHPILGVGPGQYPPFYSMDYQLDPDIAFRHLPKIRRAHTLYFEMAAETGIIGFATFMAIVVLALRRLWQARRRWAHCNPELANMATAFFLSIIAYLGTAIFLHLSYQRYYWLLLALAGAALQILRAESPPPDTLQEMPPASPQALPHAALRSF